MEFQTHGMNVYAFFAGKRKLNLRKYLIFDYETFSEAELKKCGAWEYSLHPSTEILCLAFRLGTKEELLKKPTRKWSPYLKETAPAFPVFLAALRDPEVHLVARNSIFEQAITGNVFARKLMPSKPELQRIPIERWTCTAALSRSSGLPGSLEGTGAALGLKYQKDKEGHRHMLKVCKPRKPTKTDPSTRHVSREDIIKLLDYCVTDVDSDTEAFVKLPDLHPREREFWELNQRMNLRGFQVDRELVKGALVLIERETKRLDARANEVTGGKLNSARQRAAVMKFCQSRGLQLPDLRSATVKEYLKTQRLIKDPKARELLEIREAIGRSSTAKYAAFEMRSRSDGRARDNTSFYGAHTGRESGTGLQPQNLFKTILKQEDVDAGLELIRRKDFHSIEALYEKPMDLYASAIRSCIVSKPGHTLDVGDFATIEVRVLFWLAGHQKGLDILSSGRCLYSEQAADIYGKKAEAILAGHKAGDKDFSFMRNVGKHTVLGGGFGIGLSGEKFQATCKQFGVEISLELAQKAVRAYRASHPRIPAFWGNIESAAVLAVQNPGKTYKVGFLLWKKEGDYLKVRLPIGRCLSYYKPRLERLQTLYGEKLTLTYMGTESVSKKFLRLKTWGGKLTENVVQAVARDCLKESLLRLEKQGISLPVLEVHDEDVGERKDGVGSNEEFVKTMSQVPTWAKGLPIKVEGWAEKRYRK